MQPDAQELKALDDAIEAFASFDAAFVNLVQAARRIQQIYAISKLRDAPAPVRDPAPREMSGKFCLRCGSARVREKGGGCLACLDCGFDMGCGG